ncbi:BgTH12-03819 [Blumeria graminis f. sp. triticale]|uniref:BgTH12-03819 n=1 Tax=Blumeria graminis f. sp. triticale TaxID=1689686 RepID=A0A9W4CWC3_BLUGR|nr:BgTH12-03819 [Blumeria graminis f. sp. triticale]
MRGHKNCHPRYSFSDKKQSLKQAAIAYLR